MYPFDDQTHLLRLSPRSDGPLGRGTQCRGQAADNKKRNPELAFPKILGNLALETAALFGVFRCLWGSFTDNQPKVASGLEQQGKPREGLVLSPRPLFPKLGGQTVAPCSVYHPSWP